MRSAKKYRLTEKRKTEIERFVSELGREGTLRPSLCVEDDVREIPHFFFLYEGEKMLSYAELFFPDREKVEVILATRCEYRRQGVMTRMLKEIKEQLETLGTIKSIIFIVEPTDSQMLSVMKHFGAHLLRTDYLMVLEPEEWKGTLKLENAKQWLIEHGLEEEWRQNGSEIVLLLKNQKTKELVGYGALDITEERAFLHDVYVIKKHRGAGVGRFLVEYLIVKEGHGRKIVLHVDNNKRTARHLYFSLGMKNAEIRKNYKVKIEHVDEK